MRRSYIHIPPKVAVMNEHNEIVEMIQEKEDTVIL